MADCPAGRKVTRILSSGMSGSPVAAGPVSALRSSRSAPGAFGPATCPSVQVRTTKASTRPAPILSARDTPASAARLLLLFVLLRRLRFGAARRFALRLQRALHVRHHPVTFVGTDQAPPYGVADQLLGVLDLE